MGVLLRHRGPIVIGVLLALVALALPSLAAASEADANGIYQVQVERGGLWQTVGELSFGTQYETRSIDLPGPCSRVRLVEQGGFAAQLDAVTLGGAPAVGVTGAGDPLAASKLLAADDDVTNVFGAPVTLSFAAPGTRLEVRARIQGDISAAIPFEYPETNVGRAVNAGSAFYTYATGGASAIDRSAAPFLKALARPGTGHPQGYTYVWVADDADGLFVTIDFTSDNTMDDDADYASVHVLTAAGVKDFTISAADATYGDVAFTYTDTVAYQHKLYSFSIPWSALGGRAESVQLAFTTYGTAAIQPVPMTVYRFYNAATGSHLYTASEEEKAAVMAMAGRPFAYEGIAYVLNLTHPDNNVPLHRFYNQRQGVHFYTADEAERAYLVAHPDTGYAYEGVAYYVSDTTGYTTPVHRFADRLTGAHFYTASEDERADVSARLGARYAYEGVAYYFWPMPPALPN